MTPPDCLTFEDRLARDLPKGCHFTLHHLSTPPTRCPAIYAAPPGEEAEDTYCESRFLSVSIDHSGHQLQVFAIEVLVYTTEYLTTLFVSKADSTGYLYLLCLPQGTPSPFQIISTSFLNYLLQERKRSDRRLVLSLFARAQNQYLFPGSVENSHKHVLDDRSLIRWWCKVVDPILGAYQNDSGVLANKQQGVTRDELELKSHGFLRVPGCDKYETQSFLPKDERCRSTGQHRWLPKDPLCELGRFHNMPERCLIPRFPDDPKARFVEALDDELPDEGPQSSQLETEDGPTKGQSSGRWKSVRSLEQFWEMMSFRQECSSGRLVGFLWAIFEPTKLCGDGTVINTLEREHDPSQMTLHTDLDSQHQETSLLPCPSPLPSSPSPNIRPSTPRRSETLPQRPTPTPVKAKEAAIRNQPEETKYYYWPLSSRGEVVLRQKDYQRAVNLLLRLDYANDKIAADSSRRWIYDVAERAGLQSWGRTVVGEKSFEAKADASVIPTPTILYTGSIKKKKRPVEDVDGPGTQRAFDSKETSAHMLPNMLPAGLIRKKAKIANHVGPVMNGEVHRIGKSEAG